MSEPHGTRQVSVGSRNQSDGPGAWTEPRQTPILRSTKQVAAVLARADERDLTSYASPMTDSHSAEEGTPHWLADWEARQQAKFDRQRREAPIKAAEFSARNVRVESPSGKKYIVRAVKRGDTLWQASGGGGVQAIATMIAGLIQLAFWVRGRKSNRWTVGVVRFGRVIEETVVWKEHLPAGADEKAAVAAVVAAISNGSLDIRSRVFRWRRL
jgi:hypothetical protein